MSTGLYTIGHSRHTLDAFLDLLHLHQIEVLLDTRSAPYSRFAPQFNRDALRAAVLGQGIKYGFYGRELGGRPEGGEFYDAQGHVLYSEVARSQPFQDGLARLMQGTQQYRVALLCSEEDPNVCHRRLLITRTLDGLGVSVIHIRGDGRLQTERELQAEETRLARERQLQTQEKHLAAERKTQAEQAQRAVKRELREAAARRKSQRALAAEAARREKERARQVKAERLAADREQRINERNKRADERNGQAAKVRQSAAQPQLFDTEGL